MASPGTKLMLQLNKDIKNMKKIDEIMEAIDNYADKFHELMDCRATRGITTAYMAREEVELMIKELVKENEK